jgi:hypothetical protein
LTFCTFLSLFVLWYNHLSDQKYKKAIINLHMIEDVPQAPAADFDPNLLNAADPSRVRFPERFSLEAMTAPEGAVVTEFERTPEGFMDLEWEYTEVERAVNLDFDHQAATTLSRSQLEEQATPALERMNQQRAALETPVAPKIPVKLHLCVGSNSRPIILKTCRST